MFNIKTACIEEVIEEFKQGRMIILLDDADRENEGDLVIPAELATPQRINFMAKYGRGLICLALSPEYVDRMQLPMMSQNNKSPYATAFTVSIEAAANVTTGISAYDRAHTIQTVISEYSTSEDIVTPGHVFPLKANAAGVLGRIGHTEASVDLAWLAGYKPAGVICEIMKDDGTMARADDLSIFAEEHNLKIATIADLVAYREARRSA